MVEPMLKPTHYPFPRLLRYGRIASHGWLGSTVFEMQQGVEAMQDVMLGRPRIAATGTRVITGPRGEPAGQADDGGAFVLAEQLLDAV